MTLRVLSEQDRKAFDENGYLVVPNVVPQANLDAVAAAIWQFLEMDPDDPSTWYPPERKGSIVHLHQHQALWDNRQNPRVYQSFADLLGTGERGAVRGDPVDRRAERTLPGLHSSALWVSMDRAGMKPPIDPRFPHYEDRGFVHWDLDTTRPLPERLGVQGVLALTDTTAGAPPRSGGPAVSSASPASTACWRNGSANSPKGATRAARIGRACRRATRSPRSR